MGVAMPVNSTVLWPVHGEQQSETVESVELKLTPSLSVDSRPCGHHTLLCCRVQRKKPPTTL